MSRVDRFLQIPQAEVWFSPLAAWFPDSVTTFQLCIRWPGSQPTRFFRLCLAH
jgi:hypothetical protein